MSVVISLVYMYNDLESNNNQEINFWIKKLEKCFYTLINIKQYPYTMHAIGLLNIFFFKTIWLIRILNFEQLRDTS